MHLVQLSRLPIQLWKLPIVPKEISKLLKEARNDVLTYLN